MKRRRATELTRTIFINSPLGRKLRDGRDAVRAFPFRPIVIFNSKAVVERRGFRPKFSMIQANQATELFGFNALAGRMSSIFGLLLFGGISTVTSNQRLAVISLLLFFGLGGLILSQVRRGDRTTKI